MQKILTAGLVLSVLACGIAPTSAQSGVYTPSAGSSERKAIMNALRVPVQRDLHMPVIFVIHAPPHDLRVKQGWAFVVAEFRHSNGDPMGPAFFDRSHGMMDDSASALLHRIGSQWRVVTHNTGATDVVWEDWGRTYHTPPGLVPRG